MLGTRFRHFECLYRESVLCPTSATTKPAKALILDLTPIRDLIFEHFARNGSANDTARRTSA